MGKEIKIGLGVVAVLLGVLGFVIYKKFVNQPVIDLPAETLAEAPPATKPKLASGPAQPTVLPASAAVKAPTTIPPTPAPNASTSMSPATATKPPATAQTPPNPHRIPEATGSNDHVRNRPDGRYGQAPRYQMADPSSQRDTANATTEPDTRDTTPAGRHPHASQQRDPYASPYANYDLYGERAKSPPNNPFREDQAEDVSTPAEEYIAAPERIDAVDAAPLEPTNDRYGRYLPTAQGEPTQPERGERGPNTARRQAPPSPYANPDSYDVYGRNVPRQAPPQAPLVKPHEPAVTSRPTTPAAIPASPGQPARTRDSEDQYVVQPNDNYWEISRKRYGTGDYFKALFEHNRTQFPRPDQLKPGAVITCPSAAALAQTYPDLCPSPRQQEASQRIARTVSGRSRQGFRGRVYTVEQGDTLFDIARAELGKASRWAEIYDLNRELLGNDIDYLKPGMELMLPSDSPLADPVARQPTDARLR